MYRLALLPSLLAGCDLVFELRAPAPDAAGPAGRVRTLTITQPTSRELEDFPVSIVFENDPMLASEAAPDGSDIQFFASVEDGGAELAAEVRYDGATGTLDAWTKIPTLKAGPVQIEMRYGTKRARALDPKTTWNQYLGVWHLSDSGGTEKNSAGIGIDVGANNNEIPASVPGIAGAARSFDGDDIMCGIGGGELSFGTSSFTYSIWIFVTEPASIADRALHKGGGAANNPGFNFELGTGATVANISDGESTADSYVTTGFSMGMDRWTQLTTTVERETGTMRVFVDGIENGMKPIPASFGSISGALPLCFGNAVQPFRGLLDEVRISTIVQPAEWYRAEATNLLEREQFVKTLSDEPL